MTKAAESTTTEAGAGPIDGPTGAPHDHGGLRGNITAGTPHDGENKLKGQQAK